MSETNDQYIHQHANDPDSDLFASDVITRFSQQGEQDFAEECPCIHKRISLNVTAYSHTYNLPDDVLSLRRVTWKGKKLDPLPHRGFREVFQSATQAGDPFWYIFNNIGLNQIRLFPTPSSSLAPPTSSLYAEVAINAGVIVDYFQAPDFVNAVIPLYVRRRLLKAYALYGCFNIEGEGQNLKNAQYHLKKYQFLRGKYKQLINDLHNKPRKLVVSGIQASNYFPGSPILPVSRYGQSVDRGE